MKKSIRMGYRKFQSLFVKKWVLPVFFSKDRSFDLPKADVGWVQNPSRRVWFHAASVGELESLWTLVELFAENGYELLLTVLSESAKGSLERLTQTLLSKNARIVYHGFSPWEGEWGDALRFFHPSLFVTAKYEAWPDLWMSLKEQEVPLAIVGARARRSLRIANRICQFLVGGPPVLYLFPCLETEEEDLRTLFPRALVQAAGEPRWDRVMARSKLGNERARELVQAYQNLRRPWAVIGSAWLEDLKFIQPIYKRFSGTLWVVPHKVDSDSIHKIESFLNAEGFDVLKSSQFRKQAITEHNSPLKSPHCVLIDEMGFLSEIYSAADWVYVGGGWGAGIHSTIEPAIHGIPIAIGPRGAEKFSEVTELKQSGQISILTNPDELTTWFDSLDKQLDQKSIWMEDTQRRIGATQKIFSILDKSVLGK